MSPFILVLDDNWLLRSVIRRVLEPEYPSILEVEQADRLLEWVRKGAPDLVITDICLPDSSGFALAKEVLHIRPEQKIMFLTGYRDLVSVRTAIRIGVKGYVVKDRGVPEFLQAVKIVLRGRLYLSPSLHRSGSNMLAAHHLHDVRRLLQAEFTVQEIASMLNLRRQTIQRYCRQLKQGTLC